MGRRKRKKKIRVDSATQSRRLSRAALGAPPAERVIPSKKKKPPKHKKRTTEEDYE